MDGSALFIKIAVAGTSIMDRPVFLTGGNCKKARYIESQK
jgi:hypothetical protein